ncbi:MAG: hypothetical protein JWO13_1377 [Acidobacteriales bacterium]|nr:hypothetical protein [Terriglobales bacterium]
MNRNMRVASLVVGMLLLLASAVAQNVATADLRGTVKDPNGAVVTNATVTVRDDAKNIVRTTKTDGQGEYFLQLLPPGSYVMTVEATGFSKTTAKNLNLTVGQSAELPVSMKLAAAAAEVTVDAQAEVIETQRTSATSTVNQQRIDNLPTNGRNYINFVLTNSQTARDVAPSIGAAPTSGLNIGGQRARSNLVNVDGADAEDNSVNGIRSTVSQEAVQEFQMITNGYAAEYGRASGGVVNIVTRSGGNDTHGSVYGYLRQRALQADNPFTNTPNPAYTRVQAGATLSGALKKDRTFYFLSFETTRRQETGFSTIGKNNFDLVNIDATRFGPAFGLPAGTPITIQGTVAQQAIIQNAAAFPVNAGTAQYVGLVGSASGVALTGHSPAVLGGFARFATTSIPLPASFVPLNTLTGNYPVSEGTSIWGLRLDHRLTNNQNLMLRASVSPSTVSGIQVNAQNQNFGQNAESRTSRQQYRDFSILAQHTDLIGSNMVNEFRFQGARRGLRYDFSKAAGGSGVAENIAGYGFFGREPFSYVDRVEKRFQFTDNFTWSHSKHTFKFGADYNHIPLQAQFTVNFGGLFNFGEITPVAGLPKFSPVQAYGLGLPQVFVQGVGDPNLNFTNKTLGAYIQDSWRITPTITLNYGVRYDIEFTPVFPANTATSTAAEAALGIVEGIPQDSNNIAPRIGIAWDPWKDGKTVFRASYGMFYDHPLLALAFNSAVADGTQAPQLAFFGSGSPCTPASVLSATSPVTNLNAANIFQGSLTNPNCFPAALAPALAYLPGQQRFDFNNQSSIFLNQAYLTAGFPLSVQPFGFPVASNFQYGYSQQANVQVEHQFGNDFSLSVGYNYNGGRHLNRPINVNPVNSEALVSNWEKAVAAATAAGLPTNNAAYPSSPLSVQICPGTLGGLQPAGAFAPAAALSFFRKSGLNPSLAGVAVPGCTAAGIGAIAAANNLGVGTSVPFSDMIANFSNGSSVYHGLTTNLKKRFSNHYEFLASYTWSHTIDDSTDLQSLLAPQDSRQPSLERANSTFDQRHRFVLSGVYQSGTVSGSKTWSRLASDWTVAPIIELASGRPFNILTGTDQNFDLSSSTDRPMIATAAQATAPDLCGNLAVASKYSPSGYLKATCFIDGVNDGIVSLPLTGNLKRNAGIRPYTVFTDLRIARRIPVTEKVNLNIMMDAFNLLNRFNVADVNPLYTQAGTPTAAYDPRQFQFGMKITW